jgi:hypothetical protein
MERRTEKLRRQEKKFQEMPDIVVKVVCKYRAELFFKISRKTKLSRLFNAWTERMEAGNNDEHKYSDSKSKFDSSQSGHTPGQRSSLSNKKIGVTFIFTHKGRVVESSQTPEEIGLEDSDEILAVEMLDLTKPEHVRSRPFCCAEVVNLCQEYVPEPQRQAIEKHWTDDPAE